VLYAPITIPEGASFWDMVALKGKPDIGDKINTKIIGPLANANQLSDFPDFNDATKLGSGKEKVDRLTNLIGIREAKTTSATTAYDPTCGIGSLLLKVGDETGTAVTLYGQEKDAATSGLARMNMILHDNPTALIVPGNALADPKFKDERRSRPWSRIYDCPVLMNGLTAP
jgi:type I restriction enzyme M protein